MSDATTRAEGDLSLNHSESATAPVFSFKCSLNFSEKDFWEVYVDLFNSENL